MTRTFRTVIAVAAILISGTSAAYAQSDPMVGGAAMYPTKNIVENAVNSKDHTTLVAAVKAAGLVDTLLKPENKAMLADEATHLLHGCLDGLEDNQREAIRTAFFDGVTYAELAQRQDVPLGTMKSWVRRGLARLKECLER